MTMQNGVGAVSAGLAAGAQTQRQQQLGPQTTQVWMQMINGQLTVAYLPPPVQGVPHSPQVTPWTNAVLINIVPISLDVDWLTFLKDTVQINEGGGWNFIGQGTVQDGHIDAIGMTRIGQKTNIGKFRILAQIPGPTAQSLSQSYAPAAARSTGPMHMRSLRGIGGESEGVGSMQAPTTGLGAVHIGTPRGLLLAGLGAIGLGIPGPWGANPSGIAAGGYEITGTQVALRKTAGTGGEEIGRFNPIESSPNIVAGTPDQVDFAGSDAQNATATANGLTWAFVNVKTGPLAGKQGFVAMEYMGPVGYAASHNGTGPAPNIQPQPGPTPSPSDQTASSKSNAIPWIIGGLAVAGLLVGGVIMTKKHRARRAGSHHHAVGHHAPAHAHEARRRRRRRR